MARRRMLALLVLIALASMAVPAFGTTTTTAVAETTTTVLPAVSVTVAQPPESKPDWTYRYFIPTLLVLAALVVIVTVVQYFMRVVRNRYRIVR